MSREKCTYFFLMGRTMPTDPEEQEVEEKPEEGSDYESAVDAMLSESIVEDQDEE